MRHNDEIHWKDQAAFAALQGILASGNYNNSTGPELADKAYFYAEAMFAEREKDEHNPTEQLK